jgi:glyoxylase-like metal-dependent hydrolase (beta-lactamase superfamily II)
VAGAAIFQSQHQLLVISIQSFLIRHRGLKILLDTCSGNHKQRQRPFFHQRTWSWLEKLRETGVAPDDVDLVLCSHLHVDHVGWNTRFENGQWVPTFPKARYLVARAEWEYWRSSSGIANLQRTGDFITDISNFAHDSSCASLLADQSSIEASLSRRPSVL